MGRGNSPPGENKRRPSACLPSSAASVLGRAGEGVERRISKVGQVFEAEIKRLTLYSRQAKLRTSSRNSVRDEDEPEEDGDGRGGGRRTDACPPSPSPDGSTGGSFQKSRTRRRRRSSQLAERVRLRMLGNRTGQHANSDFAAMVLARKERKEKLALAEKAFLFLEEPGESIASSVVSTLLWANIIFWTVCVIFESLARLQNERAASFFISAKYACNAIFTVEAALRSVTGIAIMRTNAYKLNEASAQRTTWRRLSNVVMSGILWLDVFTCVPFWLRVLMLPGSMQSATYFSRSIGSAMATTHDTIRVLEAMSSIRLLKLARYYEGARLLKSAILRAAPQLLVPMFMLLIMVVCFSAILVEVEWSRPTQECIELWRSHGLTDGFVKANPAGVTWDCALCENVTATAGGQQPQDAEAAAYQAQLCSSCVGFPDGHPECFGLRWSQRIPNIPTAMWFMMVIVTPAVALDPEVYPETWQGKSFVVLAIVTGVLFLAMPLNTMGRSFDRVWEERQLIKVQRLIRQLLMENGISADSCVVAFEQMDQDGNGEVDWHEFTTFLLDVLGLQITKRELKNLWRMLDESMTGTITFQQFTDALFPSASAVNDAPKPRKASLSTVMKDLKAGVQPIGRGTGEMPMDARRHPSPPLPAGGDGGGLGVHPLLASLDQPSAMQPGVPIIRRPSSAASTATGSSIGSSPIGSSIDAHTYQRVERIEGELAEMRKEAKEARTQDQARLAKIEEMLQQLLISA